MGVNSFFDLSFLGGRRALLPKSFSGLCCRKRIKKAKQKNQKWQPGSAKAQLGINHHPCDQSSREEN
jgi:hypothetical protein